MEGNMHIVRLGFTARWMDIYIYMKRGGEYVRTYYSIYTYQYMCVNKALPKTRPKATTLYMRGLDRRARVGAGSAGGTVDMLRG